jgi:hypothetical protein
MVSTKLWIWIAVAFIMQRVFVIAPMFGTQAAFFSELFPPQRRFTGLAFARELGSILAGGPAPFLAAAMVIWAHGAWWPVACYAMLVASITTLAAWWGPETYRRSISDDWNLSKAKSTAE